MKKFISILMITALALCLAGCGGENSGTAESDGNAETEAAETTAAEKTGGKSSVKIENGDTVYVTMDGDGTVASGGEDLPLAVKVTYTLDGRTVTASELEGRSGHLVMRFDYENLTAFEYTGAHTGTVPSSGTSVPPAENEGTGAPQVTGTGSPAEGTETTPSASDEGTETDPAASSGGSEPVSVHVPLAAMLMMLLDEDVFSNVTSEDANLMNMSGRTFLTGIVMPGLAESLKLSGWEQTEELDIPESITVEADVTDYTMDFALTAVQVLDLSGLGDEDLDDLTDLSEGMDDLDKAGVELMDGTGELADGAKDLADGLKTYVNGVGKIADAIGSAKDGAKQLKDSSSALTDGAKALKDNGPALAEGAKALADSGAAMKDGAAALKDNGGALRDGAAALKSSGSDLTEGAAGLDEGLAALEILLSQYPADPGSDDPRDQLIAAAQQAVSGLHEGSAQLSGGVSAYVDGVSGMADGIGAYVDGAAQLADGLDTYVSAAGQLSDGISAYADGAGQLSDGLGAYTGGVSTLYDGLKALSDGASSLKDAGSEIKSGLKEFTDGTDELADGVEEFYEEGIRELAGKLGDGYDDVVLRLRALREASAAYTYPGIADEVRFIYEIDDK